MMPRLSLMILAFLFFFFLTEAKVEESLQLKVFDPNFRASNEQMQKLLDKAALETHGYKKEVVTRAVSENGSDKQLFEKSRFYYKIVDCRTGLKEVNQELETLLTGKIIIHPSVTCFLPRENGSESTLERTAYSDDNFND